MVRLIVLFAGLFMSLCFGAQTVFAAVITPEAVTLEVLPGNRANQTVTLENDSDAVQVYTLEITGIEFGSSADDLGFTALSDEEQKWFSLSAGSVRLDPGQSQSVEVGITVPSAATVQSLPIAVIATKAPDATSGVAVTSAIASLFFVQIGQGLQANLAIDSFASLPENTHVAPVRFAALVSNSGAGLAQPEVGIRITNMWGKEVEIIPMNPTARRVPGYTNRVFSAVWEAGNWRFGPYTATVFVYPDETGKALTSISRVVLFPWQMLCIFTACGFCLAVVALLILRARRRTCAIVEDNA